MFTIPVAYNFARKNYWTGLMLSSNIIIANVGTLPGVLGAVAFTALAGLVLKQFRIIEVVKLAAYFLVFLAGFVIFYKLNPNSYTTSYLQKGLVFELLKTPGNILLYKQIVVNIYTVLLRFIIYYAPVYLLIGVMLFVKPRREWIYFMVFSMAALFFGALGASLAFGLMDALQLFSNVLSVNTVFVCVSALLVIDSLLQYRIWHYMSMVYVVTISFYSMKYSYKIQKDASAKVYGDDFVLAAQREIKDEKMLIAGYILSPAEYQSINPAWVYRNRPATFLQSTGSGYRDLIDLGILNAGYDMAKQKQHDQYYYSMNEIVMQQQQMPGVSNDSVMLACINKYKIKLLFLSKQAEIPPALLPHIRSMNTDKVSGEKMIVIK